MSTLWSSQVMYLSILCTVSLPLLLKCINTFGRLFYLYGQEVYGSSDKAMLVRILITWATRNHWITGHRGRGSPPPRHQALRPPPPPLPGTICNYYYFFYCYLDVIGLILCFYTKTPCTGSPTSTRYLAHQDECSGFSWLSTLGDGGLKKTFRIESTSINVYRYVYHGISAVNGPHKNNNMN